MHKAWYGFASILLAVCVVCSSSSMIFAEQTDDNTVDQLQQEVEQSAKALQQAQEQATQAEQKVQENSKKLQELQQELPNLKAQAAHSIHTMYRMSRSSSSLLEMLLSAPDFNSFISLMQYLNIIQTKNNDAISKLLETVNDVTSTQKELEQDKQEKDEAVADASATMNKAIEARTRAQQAAAARAEAEAAAAKAAEEKARQAEGSTFTTASGNTVTVDAPNSPLSQVNMSTDRDSFVTKWASRINSYLSGSPLAGHGQTFAEAAWDNGVDPRWSPAISTVESSKGAVCFRPHNAWGWGDASWCDWDTAIRAHVSGLARGYGGGLTPSAARKYCPPNPDFWYSRCSEEMSRI